MFKLANVAIVIFALSLGAFALSGTKVDLNYVVIKSDLNGTTHCINSVSVTDKRTEIVAKTEKPTWIGWMRNNGGMPYDLLMKNELSVAENIRSIIKLELDSAGFTTNEKNTNCKYIEVTLNNLQSQSWVVGWGKAKYECAVNIGITISDQSNTVLATKTDSVTVQKQCDFKSWKQLSSQAISELSSLLNVAISKNLLNDEMISAALLKELSVTSTPSSPTGNSQDQISNPSVLSPDLPTLSSDSISILTKQYDECIKLEHSGLRKKVGGSILLFAGTPICIIGGAIIAATSEKDTTIKTYYGSYQTTTPNRAGQAIGVSIGVAGGVTCVLVGVIQRTIGKAILKKARYEKKIIAPKLKATGNSISLICDF